MRTLVDTAMSRFAKAETRVQFVTEGGTPAQQERGEINTDAANALIEQTGSEAQLRRAALHACVFDLGVVKVIQRDNGPEVEHVPAWELMFDRSDSRRGKSTIYVQRFPADREALVAEFCEHEEAESEERRRNVDALADDIRNSGSEGMVSPDHTTTEQHCVVFELWRLPVGRQKGRHIVVTDRALCLDEEWTDEEAPFVFFGWSAPLVGPYPTSIAAIVSDLQQEIDAIATRRSQILRKLAIPQYRKKGPVEAVITVTVGSDAIGDVINVPPGCELEGPFMPTVVGVELAQEEETAWTKGFEMTGISQQSAVGSRPAGLNSAPAQREWNEINQDRLSLVALDYQQAHVDLAERLLDAVADIPEYEISTKTSDGRWLKKIRVAALHLENADYVLQKFPIGALPTTPTGKLAAAADLLQAKAIDQDEFRDLTNFPDLKAKLSIKQQSRRATEKIIGKMLTTGRYIAPPDALKAEYAAEYAAAKLLEGIADDMDEHSIDLLTTWLAEMQKRMTPPAAAPPPGMAPPPGAGPDPLAGSSIAPITPPPLAPLPQVPPPGAEIGLS